jgi:nucleoside-diphosphate-sugar epimerase
MSPGHVIITGPSGYLGRNLTACFRKALWRVSGAGRNSPANIDWVGKLDLAEGTCPDWPAADLFIHAAYDFSALTWSEIERRNVRMSMAILQAAKKGGAKRVLFISSMSAHAEARSWYGKGKWQVEQFCRQNGVMVVRPGLLYGAPQGGLAGVLAKMATQSPLLPYPYYPRGSLYACHIADVCLACMVLADLPSSALPEHPLVAAHERPWPFQELLKTVAKAQGRAPWLIPVPWRLPWSLLRLVEGLGLRPSLRSDSLISLASTISDFDRRALNLGLSFRPLTHLTFCDPTPIDPMWIWSQPESR